MPPPNPRTQPPKKDERPTPWRVEGERQPTPSGGGRSPLMSRPRWMYLILALLAYLVIVQLFMPRTERVDVPYTTFLEQVDAGNVAKVNARGETITGDFKKAVSPEKGVDARKEFHTVRPAFASEDDVFDQLQAKNVTVDAESADEGPGMLATILIYFGPTLLLVAFFVWIARRAAGGGGAGGLTGLGRSRAKRYEPTSQRVTFEDVEGIDEAEEELVEIVDFLKNPERYRRLGAAIPKGVLLSGPPGTGKTLLARAVAGEAEVPFFSLSASEFIEMVVGVGASRVRDLFEQAKKAAPAIIFIDELDAIGRARGSSSFGGSDEREQTLNQILTEMDGFTGTEGVIVIAATNRPEVLDSALLRPGRFDRRVVVNPPDKDGRRKILEVHTRSVPLADDVDLGAVAATTPGMVGADLRNLINEAALGAARRDHDRVYLGDLTDALEKIILGTERRITLSREERERTAFHESGHAVLGMLVPGADPVRKVSIVPRGRALGVTFQSPESDRYGYDESYLRGRIVGALGGRAAEEIIYGNVTTGAESDLEKVTNIARQMVGRWGMSDRIGLVSVLPGPNDEPTFFPGTNGGPSEATRELIDQEVRKIVDDCYVAALEKVRENRERIESLARELLDKETL
ncbi:MAG: cell division protease FtsH, partial [Solirubrobacteraceae bacterium]|nr:cell division protease FtsH [Solirubrobacteraceae bacterium]